MARPAAAWLLAIIFWTLACGAVNARPPKASLGFDDGTAPKLPDYLTTGPAEIVNGIPPLPKKDATESKIVNGDLPEPKKAVAKPIAPEVDFFGVESSPFTGRFTIRGEAGDGVGYTRGFAYFEGMIPLHQDKNSLLFGDVRVVNLVQEDRWEYNVGAGYRRYVPAIDRVLGVNTFYDMRKTDHHFFQQIGVGFEVLSPWLEFRTNGYFIAGPSHRVISDTGFVNLGVFNNNFIFQRIQTIEVARGGIEVELGGRLPVFHRFAPRAYAAFYSYSAEGVETANGVRGRLEAQLTERTSMHFSIQHDRVFHTTVSGGLAFHFGAPAYRHGTGLATWDDVLRQRVNRDINIVTGQSTNTTFASTPVPPPPPPPPPSEEPESEFPRFLSD